MRYSLLLLCIVAASAANTATLPIQSVYTSMNPKTCKTLEVDNEGAGWSVQQCPGVAGYKLHITEGDLRQTIEVVKPDGSKHDLNLANLVGGGGFSSVGEKAEWRVKNQSGRQTPTALIVRFNVSENPEDSTKITSYLAVAKITPQEICLTDKVKPVPKANEKARQLADNSANKPCLKTVE
jgi:hypothetical protein